MGHIEKLQKERIEKGELVTTTSATYKFPYLSDERFLTSPNRPALELLNLPQITIEQSEKVISDLKVHVPITLIRKIPNQEEQGAIIPSLGIGGNAVSGQEIVLYFDPSYSNVIESLKNYAGRQIAHEMNHLRRFQFGKMGNTLLDAVICEGLATYYEDHWGTDLETPWGHVLNEEQIRKLWVEAQEELGSDRFNYNQWFFGEGGKYPAWTGYSLGTAIIEAYVERHPTTSIKDLVRKSSKDILKKSSFVP